MALFILDGNQSATTLSTILSSGQHITAHTIVSLGTQAVTDITGAVSGSTVCVGNLGLLQSTVATEGLPASGSFIKIGGHTGTSTTGNIVHVSAVGALRVDGSAYTQPISIASVTIGNTVTIAGTVTVGNTVNFLSGSDNDANLIENIGSAMSINSIGGIINALPAGTNRIGTVTIGGGTVTIGAGTAQIGSVTASISGTVTANAGGDFAGAIENIYDVSNVSKKIAVQLYDDNGSAVGIPNNPLPISGTVTASLAISSTAITSGSFASLTSATLVPGNTARKMATVYNLGAGQLFVNAGATATTLGGGFMVALSSGDFFECNYTTTTLSAIFATAGTASWVSH